MTRSGIDRTPVPRAPSIEPARSMARRVRNELEATTARIHVMALARELGFTKTATHEIGTSVSELAANLVAHTSRGGWVRASEVEADGRVGIEIRARDDGPGIPDLGAALSDGFSTNGGLGGGLPGTRRMMDEFEVESGPRGTLVVVRKWRR